MKRLVWLAAGILLYAGFVTLSFVMELEGRSRFQVVSRADIASTEDRASRIRAEGTRQRALAEMREWGPYKAYSSATGIIVLGGSLLATILGARVIWRGVRRTSVRKAGHIVAGVLIVAMVSLLLLAWPTIVAEKRYDARKTEHVIK